MKKLKLVLLTILLVGLIGLIYQISYLHSLSATESFPEDSYLETVIEKRALIVVAHDDDNCSSGGTASKLNSMGWEVRQINFLDGDQARNERHKQASMHIMDKVSFIDLGEKPYRYDLDTVQYAYMPILKANFDQIFNEEPVSQILIETIRDFKPWRKADIPECIYQFNGTRHYG